MSTDDTPGDDTDTGLEADATATSRSLKALLDSGGGGVFRPTGAATPAGIERIATAAGWQTAVADTTGITDKRAVIGALKHALGFDREIGLNLDALVDVLRDVDNEPGTLLVWTGREDLAGADDELYRQLLDVLRSRARAGLDDTGARPGHFLTLLVS